MPSIQNVADQINAKLDTIEANTSLTAQNTTNSLTIHQDILSEIVRTNDHLSTSNNILIDGFSNLSQGLFAIQQLQLVSIGLLDHNRAQNDTLICQINNSNDILCKITNQIKEHLQLTIESSNSIKRIEGITERVYSSESGDYDREFSIKKQIEDCCPQEPVEPKPCVEECEIPEFKPFKPKGQEWKPISKSKKK